MAEAPGSLGDVGALGAGRVADLRRELEAFEAMKRADPGAIHELYMPDGRLLQRYVPAGVHYPAPASRQ